MEYRELEGGARHQQAAATIAATVSTSATVACAIPSTAAVLSCGSRKTKEREPHYGHRFLYLIFLVTGGPLPERASQLPKFSPAAPPESVAVPAARGTHARRACARACVPAQPAPRLGSDRSLSLSLSRFSLPFVR